MAQDQAVEFLFAAHTQGMQDVAKLATAVDGLRKETERLKTANAGLAGSTDTVIQNGKRYNNAIDAQSKALRQHRQGVQQLGMQFGDLATSVSTGASPLQAFNQQLGQIGYAMSMMEGNAGKFGAVLAGPLGAGIVLATSALGFLISTFYDSGDATEKAKMSVDDLAQSFDFASITGQKLSEINRLLAKSNGEVAQTALQAAASARQSAIDNINDAKAAIVNLQAKRALWAAEARNPTMPGISGAGMGIPMLVSSADLAVASVNSLDAQISNLKTAVDGFQLMADKASAKIRVLKADMDASASETERHTAKMNELSNAVGKTLNLTQFNKLMDEEESLHKSNADAIENESKKRERNKKTVDEQAKAIREKIRLDKWAKSLISKSDMEFAQRMDTLANQPMAYAPSVDTLKSIHEFDEITSRNKDIQKSYESIGDAVSGAFKGMLTAGMSWKDGMKGIIGAVIDELWKLFVVQKIVGFISNALSGAFGGVAQTGTQTADKMFGNVNFGAGFASSYAEGVKLPGFANGTNNAPGGMAWVGEHGPELVNLPRGSQVIPAHRASQMSAGGVTVNVDARGSADPAAVRAQVQAGIIAAAPSIIAAAEAKTVAGLRRPRLGGAMQ